MAKAVEAGFDRVRAKHAACVELQHEAVDAEHVAKFLEAVDDFRGGAEGDAGGADLVVVQRRQRAWRAK